MISKLWPQFTVTHTITMKMNKGDTLIQNNETQFNCTNLYIITRQGGILKSRVDIVITGHKNSLKRVSALRLKNNIANIYI